MGKTEGLQVQVVGAGTVGVALGKALEEWRHDVVFKDTDEAVRETLEADNHTAVTPDTDLDVDLTVVAVPTPHDQSDCGFDTTVLEAVFDRLSEQACGTVSVHSTLTPGATDRIAAEAGIEDYAVVPEFLFSETAQQNALEFDRLLVGASTDRAYRTVRRAFAPGRTEIHRTTPAEAELVKLASNSYAATKISFANQMWRLADRLATREGLDIEPDRLLEYFQIMSPWSTAERQLEGGRPYGGHCLPKDTRALESWSQRSLGISLPQLNGTITENELQHSR